MAPVLLGIAGGAGIALIFTRFMSGMVFGIPLMDWTTYVTTAGLMTIVALAAMAVPARRAVRIDPAVALRSDE
jgi:ABC-type antimicrobial peptide transport system permease subunit